MVRAGRLTAIRPIALSLALCGATWSAVAAGADRGVATPGNIAPHESPPGAPAVAGAASRRSPATAIAFGPYRTIQVNVDGEGRNISGDAANEPSLAVDPLRPARLVIGWRQFDSVLSSFRQAGFAFSRDQGRRWSEKGCLDPGERGSDPVLETDADGNVFYQSLRVADPPARRFTSLVFRSADGGRTWQAPAYAYGGDKPWMAIDRTEGPGRNHIYVAWSPHHSDPPYHFFTRSTDGGVTFEPPITMDAYPMLLTDAVGPDGTLYVAGVNYPAGDSVYVCRSTDARNSFVTPTFDTTSVYIGGRFVWGDSSFTHPNLTDLNGQFWIAVDHSTGPTAGNVYLLASVDPPGTDPLDVMFVRSTDGGQTWSWPIRINDDPFGPGGQQWFGMLSVAPDGRIDAVWNDTRNLGVVYMSALYYACSTDGGLTWSANTQISPLWSSWTGFPSQGKIGDYYDMESDRLGAHVAWAATFNNEQDIYYTRIGPCDCNGNGVDDSLDVASGDSADLDQDGIPDECEFPDHIGMYAGIVGVGTVSGQDGYLQDLYVEGDLQATHFFFEEGDYLRWYAEKPAGGQEFFLFPPGTCLVKTRSVAIGDAWRSFVNERTTARVVRQEDVSIRGRTLSCWVVEHEAIADGDLQGTMWFADGFGLVRYVNHAEGTMAEIHSNHLAGGSGLYPVAVGNWWSSEDPITAVGPGGTVEPFALGSRPNPAIGSTRISFVLPHPARATLEVFDVNGARVATMHEGTLTGGRHEFTWSAAASGAGMYFVRLRVDAAVVTRKLIVMH